MLYLNFSFLGCYSLMADLRKLKFFQIFFLIFFPQRGCVFVTMSFDFPFHYEPFLMFKVMVLYKIVDQY